jgi:hypothetical protein
MKNTQFFLKINFRHLCKENDLPPNRVLCELDLPSNYHTIIGVVRISERFGITIDDLLLNDLRYAKNEGKMR